MQKITAMICGMASTVFFSICVQASHVPYIGTYSIEPSIDGNITSLHVKDNIINIPVGGVCTWLWYSPQRPDTCTTTYHLEAVPNSGGHDHHDDQRPLGSIMINGQSTDTYTYYSTSDAAHDLEYTAATFSGSIRLISTHCSGGRPCFNEVHLIQVGVPNLAMLPDSIEYVKIGSTGVSSLHSGNHFANRTMLSYIQMLANEWIFLNPVLPVLKINDISLIKGGHFDINNNWRGPHKQHIFGNDVDIAYVGILNERRFRSLAKKLAGSNYRWDGVHGNHHHISLHR